MTSIDKPLISVIILNYNSGKQLLSCVESVLASNYKNFEILIVDNNSIDNSHLECKKQFSEIILIENKENFGYCEGNNIGIKNSNGNFIVILNPDTIVDPNWLSELLKAQKIMGDGIFQPKILTLEERNVIQSSGNMIQLFGFGFSSGRNTLDQETCHDIKPINFASGACFLISKNKIMELELFDPFFFMYNDDMDLCWRAALIGLKSFLVPTSKIYHSKHSALKWSGKKYFLLERNRKICLLSNYSKHTLKQIRLELFLVNIFLYIFFISKGMLHQKIKADFNILSNHNYIKNRQTKNSLKRTINDIEIIKTFNDEIFFPPEVSTSVFNKIFNKILKKLSISARKKLH